MRDNSGAAGVGAPCVGQAEEWAHTDQGAHILQDGALCKSRPCLLASISRSFQGLLLLSPSADGKVPAQAMLLQLCSPGVPLADLVG